MDKSSRVFKQGLFVIIELILLMFVAYLGIAFADWIACKFWGVGC